MATPWLANMGEGAVEQCPKVGSAPCEVSGWSKPVAWRQPVNDLPTVCISITEPLRESGKARLPKGFADVLRLEFQDYDSERKHPDSAVLFDVRMAARVSRFARKHRGKNILVHCAAGISRSGAIVEALLLAFPEYEDKGWTRYPNGLVKRLMMRALGLVPAGADQEAATLAGET